MHYLKKSCFFVFFLIAGSRKILSNLRCQFLPALMKESFFKNSSDKSEFGFRSGQNISREMLFFALFLRKPLTALSEYKLQPGQVCTEWLSWAHSSIHFNVMQGGSRSSLLKGALSNHCRRPSIYSLSSSQWGCMNKLLPPPTPLKAEHGEVKFHVLPPQQFALLQTFSLHTVNVRDAKAFQNSFVEHRRKRLHCVLFFFKKKKIKKTKNKKVQTRRVKECSPRQEVG